MSWTWRQYTNWAKESPAVLRVADFLGRGRGRMRMLDSMYRPPRALSVPDLRDWHDRAVSAVWIGHATVLIRIGGLTVLTDPVFSTRVGVGLGLATAGPARQVAPALTLHELPKIDLILLSHAHFDHLDRPTLARLSKNIPVIAAQHTKDLIHDLGFRQMRELTWGQAVELKGLKITAHRVQHWGARTFYDQHRLFNAYYLESKKHRVLFGGDTAYQTHFRAIDGADLAILGIGAYDPYRAAHATPEEAWEMMQHARAQHLLPMHHSTFRLSHEPLHEPMQRLLKEAGRDSSRIIAKRVGDEWKM